MFCEILSSRKDVNATIVQADPAAVVGGPQASKPISSVVGTCDVADKPCYIDGPACSMEDSLAPTASTTAQMAPFAPPAVEVPTTPTAQLEPHGLLKPGEVEVEVRGRNHFLVHPLLRIVQLLWDSILLSK